MNSLSDTLAVLATRDNAKALTRLSRGVEREALRVGDDGQLAQDAHPHGLGSALTHPWITTDYSEALLEFITPVSDSVNELMDRLGDIHKYTLETLQHQWLWPLSMPCMVSDPKDIKIAQYGSSHGGRMKTLYREGLTHRYGAPMQIISGVHFNFSISSELWQALHQHSGSELSLDEYRSQGYFGLIRNYRRWVWVLPYLFGASPALCRSFLGDKKPNLPFETLPPGTLYLPYATSLRMSDLGYTNKEQENLGISYNGLNQYLTSVNRAIRQPSEEFAKIGVKVDGEYRQLNDNVLQIENELYAPIRPKRVAQAGETPSQALARAGVEYIEVRALDVNPFSPMGIRPDQIRVLDLLLLTALMTPSADISSEEEAEIQANLQAVILRGRQPGLQLTKNGESVSLRNWLAELFDQFALVAEWLDGFNPATPYADALATWRISVDEPESTLSGRLLSELKGSGSSQSEWAMKLAKGYHQCLSEYSYRHWHQPDFEGAAASSHQAQSEREAADTGSFDDFLSDYFDKALAKV
ncbi:glutamate--cysteine ligase [Paraferrimonas sedimenticola]|uniref:Glutamate--cysteine ligase n=1 Tax=Paraferrimonas sedimenticola TaxID=375674 RepID=A0AA37RWN4_9GAMM|nr:glutamate--cysteine ligase [Paraferrimonas sedimenticola]GLP96816.1 glutamate--cysteine ligase [Paraferrimonas sedimenticola]